MKKISLLLLLTTFMVGTSYAGGSIFGGSKRRSSNPDGVSSIGMKICNSLNCPDVIIKQGDCGDIEHAIHQYGVCVCEEGYQALNGVCVPTGGSGEGGDTKPTTCPTGTSTEGAGGYATTLADGGMCYCETSGTVYKDGTCESKGDDNTCSSYADCDKGEYCQFEPTSCRTDPTSGECQSCRMYDIDIGDGKKYSASYYCYPDWWTAKDICASLNMHMVSLSEVGCEGKKDDFCPTEGTVYGALKAKGLKHSFWTTDMYDSCRVWYVDYTGENDLRPYDRYDSADDVLCVR